MADDCTGDLIIVIVASCAVLRPSFSWSPLPEIPNGGRCHDDGRCLSNNLRNRYTLLTADYTCGHQERRTLLLSEDYSGRKDFSALFTAVRIDRSTKSTNL